jgi:hypothetical protein
MARTIRSSNTESPFVVRTLAVTLLLLDVILSRQSWLSTGERLGAAGLTGAYSDADC